MSSSFKINSDLVPNCGEGNNRNLNEIKGENSVNNDDCQNRNITYMDAAGFSTIYLQDGQYFVPVESQTYVLQNSEGSVDHYVLNNEEPEVVQYYDEESGQIYCYKNTEEMDEQYVTFEDLNPEDCDVVYTDEKEIINVTNDIIESEAVEDERLILQTDMADGHMISIDDSVQVENSHGIEPDVEFIDPSTVKKETKYSFAILKGGKLHLQTVDPTMVASQSEAVDQEGIANDQLVAKLAAFQRSISFENPEVATDFGKIKGKNLITGQVVTLESYLERLNKRVCIANEELLKGTVRQPFLQKATRRNAGHQQRIKKFVLKKPINGRRMIGRIVKIEKKNDSLKTAPTIQSSDNLQERLNEASKNDGNRKTEKQTPAVRATSSELSKPDWEMVREIVVDEDVREAVSNILIGLMELETIQKQLVDKTILVKLVQKKYSPSKNGYDRTESFLSGHMESKENSDRTKCWEFAVDRISALLRRNEEIQKQLVGRSKKIHAKGKSNMQETATLPIVCLTLYITVDKNYKKSTRVNIEDQQKSHCPFCGKGIDTSLLVHLGYIHLREIKPTLTCEACNITFDSFPSMRKHIKMHTVQRFECITCGRHFSRHSNWSRHMEIHKKSKEVVYTCEYCGCAYNYASSLTRHIVQKHISNRQEVITLFNE